MRHSFLPDIAAVEAGSRAVTRGVAGVGVQTA